jgi:hypothetical protein
MLSQCDEIHGALLAFVPCPLHYLSTCKELAARSSSILRWIYYTRSGGRSPKKHRALRYVLCKSMCTGTDFRGTKRAILELMANTERQSMLVCCINAYHRRVAHQFAELCGLLHVSIETRLKKRRVCVRCGEPGGYKIFRDGWGQYGATCVRCRYHTDDWSTPDSLIAVESLPHKDVLISKVCQ